ncbi:phage holin family protein [Bifidobacterium longum]|uniref:phage holin family protein n=1 Tax=Bifidobacterium longum TaxID=216816 RepID=UPI0010394FC7|nr:phage holin family protein [Bifidobacterium longum]TCE41644.1 hypothetical protein MCC10042_0212 [Bifidobacterium longum subsp. longum]
METTEIAALSIVGVLIAMDYLTGLMKAVHAHDISSEKMREGLWHKSGLVLVMLLAEIVEHGQTWLDMGFALPLIVPAAAYISITEISSIIENIAELNPELRDGPLLDLFRSEKEKGGR